jgi:methylated-DNA-[protein]-cysteine S-methyltransferase
LTLNSIIFFNNKKDIIDYLETNDLNLKKSINPNKDNLLQNLFILINDYFSGKKLSLYQKINDLKIDLNLKDKFSTEFALKVIQHILSINYGEVSTYSDIGKEIGSKAYRAIGNVLRKNPLPLIIPCHRIIRKNGKIGGFMGKMNNTWQQNLKKYLLNLERQNSI